MPGKSLESIVQRSMRRGLRPDSIIVFLAFLIGLLTLDFVPFEVLPEVVFLFLCKAYSMEYVYEDVATPPVT